MQHDVAGLIDLLGGREAFLQKLDMLFSTNTEFHVGGYGKVIHEMTEAKLADTGQYAHINEPVHHVITSTTMQGNRGKPSSGRAPFWIASTVQGHPAGWATRTRARCRPGTSSARWVSIR